MNDYQALTAEIQVPKDWPINGIENIVTFLSQDAINYHRSGKKFVMTIGNVPAMIKDNWTRPGYVFKRIKEVEDEDTYRIDVIIPTKISILKHTNNGSHNRNEESVECLPMNLKFDHPIAQLVSTSPDRHTVLTLVPDVEKVLLIKGIMGLEKYDYTLRTTYRIHNIKWLDYIISNIQSSQSTTESSAIDAHQISKNKWDIVSYSRLPRPQRFWYSLEVATPWITYSSILVVLATIMYFWVFIIQKIPLLYNVGRTFTLL